MKTVEKIDLYKLHKDEYAATRKPRIVNVAPARYLAISGQGAPGGEAFTDAIGALYGVAFTVKMTRKFAGQADYAVCKLEALWSDCFGGDRSKWRWTMLIRTPEFVADEEVRQAIAVLQKRGKGKAADRVALESLGEGQCVQALHVGPYEDEGTTVSSMQAFAEGKGLRFDGRHHEIYLSDPRRVPPTRLRTILREPVRRV